MQRIRSSVAILGLVMLSRLQISAVAADKPQDEAAQAELKKLQGDWELHGDEVDGRLSRAMPDRSIPFNSAYSIEGERLEITWTHGDIRSTLSGTIKLMPTEHPPGIDLVYETAAGKPVTLRGVYELKQDRLRIRWAKMGSEKRPDKVETTTGDDTITQVYLRSKRTQPVVAAPDGK